MYDKDRWSDGNQVYFLDGWAWGVNFNLVNICLGTEESIIKAMKEGTDNPVLQNILTLDRA